MSKHSQEFKLEVVQYYLSNKGGYRATARYFNIDQSTVVYLKKRRALIQKKKEQEKAEQQRLQDSYLN